MLTKTIQSNISTLNKLSRHITELRRDLQIFSNEEWHLVLLKTRKASSSMARKKEVKIRLVLFQIKTTRRQMEKG
jgi:hypothetical protein